MEWLILVCRIREFFMEETMEERKKDTIYELDGTVPLKKALPLGIQHILAMFLGNISPLIIIAVCCR